MEVSEAAAPTAHEPDTHVQQPPEATSSGSYKGKTSFKKALEEPFTHLHLGLRLEDSTLQEPFHVEPSRWVLLHENPIRMVWSCLLSLLLAYTATGFIYRLVFLDFHIGPSGIKPLEVDNAVWNGIDTTTDVLFWVDLFVTFLFSYKDERGLEVSDPCKIAKHYLSFSFWVNLIACLPESLVSSVFLVSSSEVKEGQGVETAPLRLYRLQRLSRMARLSRISRLGHVRKFHIWKRFESYRGFRIVNFTAFLLWVVHLVACGWYLVAALSPERELDQTWVARHSVDKDGTSLRNQSAFEQWLVSMYFIMNVFTTVGFGDISAFMEAEIIYVGIAMMIGAVVHSIIINEVIGVVTTSDQVQKAVEKENQLIEAYASHAELPDDVAEELKREVDRRAGDWAISYGFNKKEMTDMLTGMSLPRWLLAKMPKSLFDGALERNSFLKGHIITLPPRLPCILAIHLVPCQFDTDETVFQMGDYAFSLFLIMHGVFAHVGRPGERRGLDSAELDPEANPQEARLSPYRLFGPRNYFGDTEILFDRPRFSTTRCMKKGEVLLLHKADFCEVMQMFPQYSAAWASAARSRERYRANCLENLRQHYDCYHLAKRQIVSYWRLYRRRKGGSNLQSGVSGTIASAPLVTKSLQPQHQAARARAAVDGLRADVNALRQEVRELVSRVKHTPCQHCGHIQL